MHRVAPLLGERGETGVDVLREREGVAAPFGGPGAVRCDDPAGDLGEKRGLAGPESVVDKIQREAGGGAVSAREAHPAHGVEAALFDEAGARVSGGAFSATEKIATAP